MHTDQTGRVMRAMTRNGDRRPGRSRRGARRRRRSPCRAPLLVFLLGAAVFGLIGATTTSALADDVEIEGDAPTGGAGTDSTDDPAGTDESVPEESVPDESIFRAQFARALEGEGDSDGDGYVTGTELGEFLQTLC